MSKIKAVAFDLDGLMFNTEDLYQAVGTEVLRRRGRQFTGELLDAMMGRPAPAALAIMIRWHGLTDTVEALAAEGEEIFPALLDARLALMPGLADLLDDLERAGIPKAVATSSGLKFTRDVLRRFNLEPRFAFLLTAEDVAQGKPDPEIYFKAAEKLGVAPEEMLVLEDSHNGCKAAAAAGAVAVAVPGGHSRRHDFSMACCCVESLADPRIRLLLEI